MKQQEFVGLRVRIHPDSSAEAWSFGDFFSRSLLMGILFTGITGTFASGFPSADIAPWMWISVGCTVSVLVALLYTTVLRARVLAGGVLLIAAYGLILAEPVKSGLGFLANDFLDYLTAKTGRIFLHYAAGEAASGALMTALIPIFLLLALQIGAAVCYSDIWMLLPPVLTIVAGCAAGFLTADAYLILAAAGACWLLIRRTQTENDGVMLGGSLPAILTAVALSAAVSAGIALLLAGAVSDFSANGQSWLAETLHRLRYDSPSNSMPEGELAEVSSWEKNDTVALEATMEQPQKLYLRGMLGETYTGTSWEPLSGDAQAEYKDLFYWLHQEDFYGQSEIASAGLMTQDQPEISSIRITNLTACKQRMFLPYAVCTSDLFDAMRIGDAAYAEENAYSLKMLTGSVPDWYVYQSALADRQTAEDPEALAFLDNEQAYRQYVYENDLTITDEACEALVTALGTETDALSLEEIKSRIRGYLDTNMEYDENVSRSGEADFLVYTLRKGRGYSVHYATLAALMLRYYGVPARYVEGYFLSAAEAEGFTSGDTIPLDENHAHAWAEYYLDGVGWIPFEVTPGYFDDEEIELETVFDENSPYYQEGAKSYSRSYVSKHRPSPEIVEPEETQNSAAAIGETLFRLSNLFWALLVLLVLLLLWVLRGRIRLRRTLRRISELPEEEAVTAWFGYAMALMRLAGFRGTPETEHFPAIMARWAGEPTGLYEKAYEDNLAAKFGKTAEAGRRDFMEEFAGATVGLCLNRWTCRQRLYYRWIDCWYL